MNYKHRRGKERSFPQPSGLLNKSRQPFQTMFQKPGMGTLHVSQFVRPLFSFRLSHLSLLLVPRSLPKEDNTDGSQENFKVKQKGHVFNVPGILKG